MGSIAIGEVPQDLLLSHFSRDHLIRLPPTHRLVGGHVMREFEALGLLTNR